MEDRRKKQYGYTKSLMNIEIEKGHIQDVERERVQ